MLIKITSSFIIIFLLFSCSKKEPEIKSSQIITKGPTLPVE
jgi:hypothetical protein